MNKITKQDIERLAKEIMIFLEDNDMLDGVSIYFNNKRVSTEFELIGDEVKYIWKEESTVDPNKYLEYASYNHILSMSFEGTLYNKLNYEFDKRIEEFYEIFKRYGLYFELGNSWNLTAYPINDNMDIEYTIYRKLKETIYLYRRSEMPVQLKNIMDFWYGLSEKTGDKGSCIVGAGFAFEWNGDRYFMPAQSPWQGSISWEEHIDVIRQVLENFGATEIYYNWGRID